MPVSPPPQGSPLPGVFVAFEGGDGAGKSTQADLLATWLRDQHGATAGDTGGDTVGDVVRTREPGGTTVGLAIRQVLLHGEDLAPRAEALLFAADRAHHIATVVRPALERGATVVSDRYMDSSIAYQAAARGLAATDIESLSLWATEHLRPDLTVLLDLDPALGRGRVGSAPDRLEREGDGFHARVRTGFLDLAARSPQRYLVLDATQDQQSLQEMVRARMGAMGLAPRAAGGASTGQAQR